MCYNIDKKEEEEPVNIEKQEREKIKPCTHKDREWRKRSSRYVCINVGLLESKRENSLFCNDEQQKINK